MSRTSHAHYDLILLGASGYTGKLAAEYIATNARTNLKWAVAGRSAAKLDNLVSDLKTYNPDRMQPGIEVTSLAPAELTTLVNKTRVLINTVGPYHLKSTPVVEACAKNGVHYFDVTGESPWVLDLIRKYHEVAKTNNAIIVPEIGIESAPSDLISWALVQKIRKECGTGTREIIASVKDIKGLPSGGTAATVLSILDSYSITELMKSGAGNWASSPVPYIGSTPQVPFLSKLFGVRTVPDLGLLTSSPMGGANTAVVQRSWGLIDSGKIYGPNFQYHEYASVRSAVLGSLFHFALGLAMLALAFPPVRWLAKRFVHAPGEGSSKQDTAKEFIEFGAVATADETGEKPRRALGRLRYDGGLYYLTGIFLVEAAMVLLDDPATAKKLRGGLLTPATLGQPFVDRMKKAGMVLETEMLP